MRTLNYTEINGLLCPQIEIGQSKPLKKYGRLRRRYLKEHRAVLYNHLILNDELFAHLNEIDNKAQTLLDKTLPIYAAHFEITPELKRADQMEWVRRMNMARSICDELISIHILYV